MVAIHFTGLPNELREIIGSLKMHTKQSIAAARGLVPPKKKKILKMLIDRVRSGQKQSRSNQEKLNLVTSL